MTHLLIAEDSPTQSEFLRRRLEREGFRVSTAPDGVAALAQIRADPPALVLTDLKMPGMDGLALVQAVQEDHPGLPVILMTEFGSEDVAAEALRRGAVSYIPKRRLDADLLPTVERVLALTGATYRIPAFLAAWRGVSAEFVFGCSGDAFAALLAYVTDALALLGFGDEAERMRVSLALHEALENALYHGNLELPSQLREEGSWQAETERRRARAPYSDRRLFVRVALSREDAVFTIRDEGPGFDPRRVPDPRCQENLLKLSGRGLLIIHTFMDEVTYNGTGNEVTMRRRRPPAGEGE